MIWGLGSLWLEIPCLFIVSDETGQSLNKTVFFAKLITAETKACKPEIYVTTSINYNVKYNYKFTN